MNRATYFGLLNISLRSKKHYIRECGRIKKQRSPVTKSVLLKVDGNEKLGRSKRRQ
jgi:hypothetical protein